MFYVSMSDARATRPKRFEQQKEQGEIMPRSRILGIYMLVGIFALGAGMLVAQFLGTSATLPSGSTTAVPTAVAAIPTAANATAPTAVSADLPTVAASPEPPTALASTALPTATLELPLAPTATPATSDLGYIEYTVQSGDILTVIARRHNVTVEQILAINQIPNPDSLVVASVIRIPTQ
jgi:LysM repeat protein